MPIVRLRRPKPAKLMNEVLHRYVQGRLAGEPRRDLSGSLHAQGRGALRRELTACLRTGRALCMARTRVRGKGRSFVQPEILIREQPAEIADRAMPGHWEGDLILGLEDRLSEQS